MLFRESERVLYQNNPLAEVICQFRFPTILRIREGQLSAFQDEIYKDYPIYTEQEPSFEIPSQLPREFAAIIEQIKIPNIPGLVTRKFSTKNTQRLISLSEDFMALAETKYEKWGSFREEIIKTESALKKVYNPAFYSRIGLRYRDIISRGRLGLTDFKWKDLLEQHIISELGDETICDSILRIQTRAVIKLPDIPNGQITLIHGLIRPQGIGEDCYLIDADFSAEGKEGIDEPFNILDRFNRLAGQLFRWAIREKLHHAMGPRAV